MSRVHPIKIAYDPVYVQPLPPGHRFPMLKYELIPEQLLYEGTITHKNLFSPIPCPDERTAAYRFSSIAQAYLA
jgi:hypothetical protein